MVCEYFIEKIKHNIKVKMGSTCFLTLCLQRQFAIVADGKAETTALLDSILGLRHKTRCRWCVSISLKKIKP